MVKVGGRGRGDSRNKLEETCNIHYRRSVPKWSTTYYPVRPVLGKVPEKREPRQELKKRGKTGDTVLLSPLTLWGKREKKSIFTGKERPRQGRRREFYDIERENSEGI